MDVWFNKKDKNMKKNLFKKYNWLTLFIFTLLFIAFCITNYFCYKDYGFSLWLNKIYEKKIAYANSIKTNKIVIVGGSNVLYSVKTEEIEKKIGIPVVNAGTNAGLGLRYLLDRVKRDFIKPGDIVLLSVADDILNLDDTSPENFLKSGILFKYIVSFDKKYMHNLNIYQKVFGYLTIDIKDLLKSLIFEQNHKKQGLDALVYDIYSDSNLNKNGDQLLNKGHMTAVFNKSNPTIKEFKEHLNEKSSSMIQFTSFIQWCKNNNIKILYTYPSIPFHKEYNNSEYNIFRNDLNTFLAKNSIKILNTKDVYFLSNDNFYDTNLHLNEKGREIRTSAIIRELKKLQLN